MIESQFSYENYRKILLKYKERFCDFSDVSDKNSFVLLRHDVEFSTQRALQIAQIEYSECVKSSFLFQVRSNAYNVLSIFNRDIIEQISGLGHKVGLHFYVSHIKKNDWNKLELELEKQKEILEFALDSKIDRFSFHRPPEWVLKRRDDLICDMINMYGESFFEFSPKPKSIKYIADSKHQFKYGDPQVNTKFTKIQLLLHPDEWSNAGLDAFENFRTLEDEHLHEFFKTINNETKIYKKNLPESFIK